MVKRKDSLIYLMTAGANAAVPFLTLPLLTRLLSPEDFGVIATYVTLVTIASVVIRFEINTVVKKLYSQTPQMLPQLFGATLSYCAVWACVGAMVVLALLMFDTTFAGVGAAIWACVAWVAVARLPALVLHNYWHISRKVLPYVCWSLLALGGTHALTLGLAASVLPDWRARMFVEVGVSLAALIAALVILKRQHGAKLLWDLAIWRQMIAVAAPIWPGAVVVILLFSIDRIMLLALVPLRELGVYSVAVQFAAVITLVFSALSPPFEAWAYQSIKPQTARIRMVFLKRFVVVAPLSLCCALALGVFMTWFVPFWVAPEFASASQLVLPLTLALCCFGLFRLMNICLICLGRFGTSSTLSIVSLAIVTGWLAILIPQYGLLGATYGLFAGFGCAMIIQTGVILWLMDDTVDS